MSWLSGNDNTTFLTDLGSLWHNATTGQLTDAQKTEISQATTQEYNPCANDLSSPECVALQSQSLTDIQSALPDNGCVLNVPFIPCFKSWSSVLFFGFAVFAGIWLLKTAIESAPAYYRGRR